MSNRSSTGLVSEIVLATSRLISALEGEVEALRRGDIASLERTRGEKARLIRSYEAKLQALQAQPTLRASVAPAIQADLADATRRLQAAIDRNVAQLRAAAEANRRLVEALAKAAAEANERPSYGPGRLGPAAALAARAGRPGRAGSAHYTPVSVSRQL